MTSRCGPNTGMVSDGDWDGTPLTHKGGVREERTLAPLVLRATPTAAYHSMQWLVPIKHLSVREAGCLEVKDQLVIILK